MASDGLSRDHSVPRLGMTNASGLGLVSLHPRIFKIANSTFPTSPRRPWTGSTPCPQALHLEQCSSSSRLTASRDGHRGTCRHEHEAPLMFGSIRREQQRRSSGNDEVESRCNIILISHCRTRTRYCLIEAVDTLPNAFQNHSTAVITLTYTSPSGEILQAELLMLTASHYPHHHQFPTYLAFAAAERVSIAICKITP